MEPVARTPVYEAYWRFAAERQAIFYRRLQGNPRPWTDDPILHRFKFCNVYRASDRVSQYLMRRVIYRPPIDDLTPDDMFLRVILFRLFSKESTWEAIERTSGGLRRASFDPDRLGILLDELQARQTIYTSAFILPPDRRMPAQPKHRSHLALVAEMFGPGRLGGRLARARSLREVYETLLEWPTIGPFLAYQMTVDLNYTDHLDFSENDFTVPGPGAIRGLRKVFEKPGDRKPHELIQYMVERQEEEFSRLGLSFQDLFGRRLHAVDCQGLFCEVDKYSRELFPDLKSERARIKHRFEPSSEPLPLFYPPKWGINEQITDLDTAHGPPARLGRVDANPDTPSTGPFQKRLFGTGARVELFDRMASTDRSAAVGNSAGRETARESRRPTSR